MTIDSIAVRVQTESGFATVHLMPNEFPEVCRAALLAMSLQPCGTIQDDGSIAFHEEAAKIRLTRRESLV